MRETDESVDVKWLSRDEFLKAFEENPVRLDEYAFSWVSFEYAMKHIPHEPLNDPPDADDGLGAQADWYGITAGLLFVVRVYKQAAQMQSLIMLQEKVGADFEHRWQPIATLCALPAQFLENLVWISPHPWRRRDDPVKRNFPYILEVEHEEKHWALYWGDSLQECEALALFLKKRGNRFVASAKQNPEDQ